MRNAKSKHMRVNIKKVVEQAIELNIEVPAYFRTEYYVIRVNRDGSFIRIGKSIITSSQPSGMFYESELSEIVREGTAIGEAEFMDALQKCIDGLMQPCDYHAEVNYSREKEMA